ncbi:hypothetical protein Tco_1252247 [Tanacetum coccineum]
MSGTVLPIPPPLETNTGNAASPNRIGTIPNDNTNNTTTNNVAQNVVNEDLSQLLDSRGGSYVTNVPDFYKEDISSWKDRFLVYLDGLEPYLLECTTAKSMWTDLVLTHEGPSDTRDTKIAALRLKFNALKALEGEKVNGTFTRLKCLLNDLKNNGVSNPQAEDEEFASSEDEGVTKVKAFMAIAEDEPSVRKTDARSGQWVKITMKKVHRLLSMTDGEERKHVLDYTYVDLHYVEDQRKNLLNMFISLNQELSSCKSELCDLKNTKAIPFPSK